MSATIHNYLSIALLACILVGAALPELVSGQSCGCATDMCCSLYGYCGTGDDYCGTGCQAGPCTAAPTPTDVSISDIVTDEFFNGITGQANASCAGQGFYTRSAFLEAVDSFPLFGQDGSIERNYSLPQGQHVIHARWCLPPIKACRLGVNIEKSVTLIEISH